MKWHRGENIRTKCSIIFGPLCLFLCVLIIFLGGKKTKAVYSETYYGELVTMYDKLEQVEGKKLVIVGNSSVAFGVESALVQSLLEKDGYDYTVCNFGLYGSIGTRAMLELLKDKLNPGDILIFMPEADNQSQSLYFSATELWKAIENRTELIYGFDKEMIWQMLSNYPESLAARRKQSEPISVSGVYSAASFDENGDLKNYDRSANIMEDGIDKNNPVNLDLIEQSAEYFSFINDYNDKLQKNGVAMYFAYGPINRGAVEGSVSDYVSRLNLHQEFPTIGNIEDSIMDSAWFYDSNFHLNQKGMEYFSVTLVNALKTHWGDSRVTEYSLPEKPGEETETIIFVGDDSDSSCFLYEECKGGLKIVGLSAEGKERYQLTVPTTYEGEAVVQIDTEAFKKAEKLKILIIQENIKNLPDFMFEGSMSLKEIRLTHTSPDTIKVGYHLLSGAQAKVFVQKDYLSLFANNYFWGYYGEVMEAYE